MSLLELLWIPAVLGWLPLIYADELSEQFSRGRGAGGRADEADPASDTALTDSRPPTDGDDLDPQVAALTEAPG